MRRARQLVFEPFRLDVLDERLWRGERSIRLGHKALSVLERLLAAPGRLVTKDELLDAAWPKTAVGEAVLTTAIRELRRALGDRPRAPRFVETVHGRGYRFIAPVTETAMPSPEGGTPTGARGSLLVGRDEERARLREWFTAAARGTRRIGFVSGEAGIGKTVLVEDLCSELGSRGVRIGRGQSIEHYGAGEAYLPLLEALGRLGRDPALRLADVLREHAPSWLPHLAPFAPPGAPEPGSPVTPARMLRELAEAIEILAADDPLVLVLEDLHWSDAATLEWLAYVTRRRDPARLLVLATYRPLEALLHKHPLRSVAAELRHDPQCGELVLDSLPQDAVETWFGSRFGNRPRLAELAEICHRRTGGHPLFLGTIVDELDRRGMGRAPGGFTPDELGEIARIVPPSVRRFIEHRLERLSPRNRPVLEAAAVAGDPFSVAAVAAGAGLPPGLIENRCADWSREGWFLVADGTVVWPDGTVSARYRFRHALFQEVAFRRLSPERRVRLHRRIGSRLERAFGRRAADVAAELAMHFDEGREPKRAIVHFERAAENALRRSAYAEARRHLERGLALLAELPEGRERLRRELDLSIRLAQVLATTRGWAMPEVEQAYARSLALCDELGDGARKCLVLWGLIGVSLVRGRIRKTAALSETLLRLSAKRRDRPFRVAACMEFGGTALLLGEPASGRGHFRKAEAAYDRTQHRLHLVRFGCDLGLFSRTWETHLLWYLGFEARARAQAETTLSLARDLGHPFSLAITLAYAMMLHQFCRDTARAGALAEATVTHCREHGFPYYLAWAEVTRGWSRVMAERDDQGIDEIRRGLEVLRETAGVRLPYYRALLAEAYGHLGRDEPASAALDEAFAAMAASEERFWEPELHRLRGEQLRSAGRHDEAEACFRSALDVARRQQARILEVRASSSLARLWRDRG